MRSFPNSQIASCPRAWCLCLLAMIGFLLVTAGSALGQVTVGPPDDPYTFADSSAMDGKGFPEYIPSSKATTGGNPIDTANISSIDPTQFPEICTYVEILDSEGNPVGGLDEDSFCVYQDSIRIDSFSVVESSLDSCRTSICLVIDVSGSMANSDKLDEAKDAAHAFIDQMDTHDRMAIVKFSDCYSTVQGFTSDTALLHAGVTGLTAGGFTAAFDGIWGGVQLTAAELSAGRSLAVIALSDGMENRSWLCAVGTSPDGITLDGDFSDDSTMIVSAAISNSIPIYTISLGSGFDPTYLTKLAAGSGGSYHHAPDGSDIIDIYEEIKFRLCSRYLICYLSPDTISDGDCHVVRVCYQDETGVCGPCDTIIYCEPTPPEIRIVAGPDCIEPDSAVILCAYVVDSDTPPESLTVQLYYRTDFDASYTSVFLDGDGDSLYCDTLPGSLFPCSADGVQFYVTASDGHGTVASPADAPDTVHQILVCPNEPPTCSTLVSTGPPSCLPPEAHVVPIISTDPEGGPVNCVLTGDGELVGGAWQVLNPGAGQHVSARVVCYDECGDSCWIDFDFTFPTPTDVFCNLPNDTMIHLCTPTLDSLPVSATGGAVCKVIAGPGAIQGGYWVYQPSGDNDTAVVTVECATECDTCRGTFDVFYDIDEHVSIDCPPNVRYECDSIGEFGEPTVDDENPETVVLDVRCDTVPGDCPQEYVITKTWVATDECGNVDSCKQEITIYDETPPTITCPPDTLVSCDELPEAHALAQKSPGGLCIDEYDFRWGAPTGVVDNCDPNPQFCLSNVRIVSDPITSCDVTYEVTFAAYDACGNYDTCTQRIRFVDTTAPEIACPDTGYFPCGTAILVNPPSAVDNCDNGAFVELDTVISDTDVECPQVRIDTYVWVATDECGNSDTCRWAAVFLDTLPPVLLCLPADSIDCDSEGILPQPTAPEAFDLCDTNVTVQMIGDTTLTDDIACPVIGIRAVTWEAIDHCGNADTCVQRTYLIDTLPPELECVEILRYECDSVPESWEEPTATDLCDTLVEVSLIQADTTDVECGYVVVLIWEAVDDCDNSSRCLQEIIIYDETPPLCDIPDTARFFVCEPGQEICLIVGATDSCDDSVECRSDIGTVTDNRWCYNPTFAGSYWVHFTCVDDCGNECVDSTWVEVSENRPPTCEVPPDTTVFLCDSTHELLCLGEFKFVDPDGNLDPTTQLIEVKGSQGNGVVDSIYGTYCLLPASYTSDTTLYIIFSISDTCGDSCIDTTIVNIQLNDAPRCFLQSDTLRKFLCEPDSVCFDWDSFDQDGNLDSCSFAVLEPDGGKGLGRTECLWVESDTTMLVELCCVDSCGATCYDTIVVIVNLNEPPVCEMPNDTTIFLCEPDSVYLSYYNSTDPDFNLSHCDLILLGDDSAKTFDASDYYYADRDTTVTFIIRCWDQCDEYCEDTFTVTFELNEPPVCADINDTTLYSCDSDSLICWELPLFWDPDNNLDPSLWVFRVIDDTKGLAEIDTVLGTVCVDLAQIPSDTTFTIEYGATDSCGESCLDTFLVTVLVNEPPRCYLEADTLWKFLCDPDTVCFLWNSNDPDGNLDTCTFALLGDPDKVPTHPECFYVESDSILTVEMTCIDSCGATCVDTIVIIVDVNEPPVCDSPNDTTLVFCGEQSTQCLYVSVSDADGNLFAEGGYWAVGLVGGPSPSSDAVTTDPDSGFVTICWTGCPYDHDTTLTFFQLAVDACGDTCTDTFTVTLDCNEPPVCDLGNDTTLTFCLPDECDTLSFGYGDSDSDYFDCILNLIDPNGDKSVDTGLIVICNPGIDTVFYYELVCYDSCGSSCYDTVKITVDGNLPPICDVPGDTSIFLCDSSDTVMLPVGATDPENGEVTCRVVAGPGMIEDGWWIYTPRPDAKDCNTCGDGTGPVCVWIECEDECGNVCADSFCVSIIVNQPPFVIAPPDKEVWLCGPDTICLGPWPEIDFNNNVRSRFVHFGWMQPPLVCFYADTSGLYTIDCCVEDSCGALMCDTTYVLVHITPPVECVERDDTLLNLCDPALIEIDVDSAFGDSAEVYCSLVDGPGSLEGGIWSYYAEDDTSFCVTISCRDSCDNLCIDTFCVTIIVADPPECKLPDDTLITQCEPTQICLPVGLVTPPGNTLAGGDLAVRPDNRYSSPGKTPQRSPQTKGHEAPNCELLFGPGTIDGGLWCYLPPEGDTSFYVGVRCYDTCNNYCEDSFKVDIHINTPPVCIVPNDTTIYLCEPDSVCLPYGAEDPDGNIWICRQKGKSSDPLGVPLFWCYYADRDTTIEVIIEVFDKCGAMCSDTFNVTFELNDGPVCGFLDLSGPPPCPSPQIPLLIPFQSVDPNDDPTTCELLPTAKGTLNGNIWTLDPVIPGDMISDTIVCSDSCGAACTLLVEFQIPNPSPPICNLPDDQTRFLCDLVADSLPVSAIGGECSIVEGPGELRNGYWVYTPSGEEQVTVAIECEGICETCSGEFTITYQINEPPSCAIETDTARYRYCEPGEICFGGLESYDPDGNLDTCYVANGIGELREGKGEIWCFYAEDDDTFDVIIRCEDSCGAFCEDTFTVIVDINDPPVCNPRNDTTIFLCQPTELYFEYAPGTDPDFPADYPYCYLVNGDSEEKSGFATWWYYADHDTTVCFVIRCVDNCQAFCEDTFCVTIEMNEAPVCEVPNDTTIFLCEPTEVCLPFGGSDPDGNLWYCQVIGIGCKDPEGGCKTYDGFGEWCWYSEYDESIEVIVRCVDSCGAVCEDTFRVTFEHNEPPVCEFQTPSAPGCTPPIAFVPFTTSDADSNFSHCVLDGPGELTEAGWQYVPTPGETIDVTIHCYDSCGAFCEFGWEINYPNPAPVICDLPNDTTIMTCGEEEICLPIAGGNCEITSGPGTLGDGQWCYTPSESGEVTVEITCYGVCDSCVGSFTVNFTINEPPVCNVPNDTTFLICEPTQICLPVSASDPDNNLWTCTESGPGTLSNGNWCYTASAETSFYSYINCIDSCGASCFDSFKVTIELDDPPSCDHQADTSLFLCEPTTICVAVPAVNADSCQLLTSQGTLSNGQWCYNATVDEIFDVIIRCFNECGECRDTFRVSIDMNEEPICNVALPQTFIVCEGESICLPISGTDPEGGLVVCELLDGLGEIINGQWCYTPMASGFVPVTIRCTDPCGGSCQVTRQYSVIVDNDVCTPGSAQILPFPDDTKSTGDVDDDGKVDLFDLVAMVSKIYRPAAPTTLAAGLDNYNPRADVNCDGKVDVADVTLLAEFLFRSGQKPCGKTGPAETAQPEQPGTDDQPAGSEVGSTTTTPPSTVKPKQ